MQHWKLVAEFSVCFLCLHCTSTSLYSYIMTFSGLFKEEFRVFLTVCWAVKQMFSGRQRRITLLFPCTIELAHILLLWLIVPYFGVQSEAPFNLTLNHDYISSSFSAQPQVAFSAITVRTHCLLKLWFHVGICSCSTWAWKCQRYLPQQSQACPQCPTCCGSPRIWRVLVEFFFSECLCSLRATMLCCAGMAVFVCSKLPYVLLCCVFGLRRLGLAWEKLWLEARESLKWTRSRLNWIWPGCSSRSWKAQARRYGASQRGVNTFSSRQTFLHRAKKNIWPCFGSILYNLKISQKCIRSSYLL